MRLETGETYHTIAPEGFYEGQPIQVGSGAPMEIGNVLPLGEIPEVTMVCDVELMHACHHIFKKSVRIGNVEERITTPKILGRFICLKGKKLELDKLPTNRRVCI